MLKNKKKLLMIGIILIIAIAYFSYQTYNYYYYKLDIDFKTIENWGKYGDDITLKKPEKTPEQIVFQDIRVGYSLKDFVSYYEDENGISFKYKDDSYKSLLVIRIGKPFINYFEEPFSSNVKVDKKIKKINHKAILEKYDITNDLELLEFIKNNWHQKNNFFNSKKKMQEIYAIQNLLTTIPAGWDHISLISGDYKGYAFVSDELNGYSLLIDDKLYGFTFSFKDYFNRDIIKEFMDSIVIES